MKSLEIRKVNIENFKKIVQMEVEFGKVTTIKGKNQAGKTTVVDAINYLLFGQTTDGDKTGNVQRHDVNGIDIPKLKTRVEAIIEYDNGNSKQTISLAKERYEKWTKPRGAVEEVFGGYTTDYFINNVPKKMKEFTEYIENIVKLQTFQRMSMPEHFPNEEWKPQREELTAMSGVPTIIEMAMQSDEYSEIMSDLEEKTTDEMLKEYMHTRKRIASELEGFEPTIIEASRNLSNDVEASKKLGNEKHEELKRLEAMNVNTEKDKLKNDLLIKRNAIEFDISEHKQKFFADERQNEQNFMREHNDNINILQNELSASRNELQQKRNDYDVLTRKRDADSKQLKELREKAQANLDSVFISSVETECAYCKRPYEETSVQEQLAHAEAHFNENKAKLKAEYEEIGIPLRKSLEDTEEEHLSMRSEIDSMLEDINKKEVELQARQGNAPVYEMAMYVADEKLEKSLADVNEEIENINNENNSNDNSEEIAVLKNEIKEIELEINTHLKAVKRVEELKTQQKLVNTRLAEMEHKIDLVRELVRKQVDLTESKVSEMFEITKFKMFKELVNGGIEEMCMAQSKITGSLYHGAGRMSTSERINAGVDIIKGFQEYYQFKLPLFVDNKESNHTMPNIDTQIIFMEVDSTKNELEVVVNE